MSRAKFFRTREARAGAVAVLGVALAITGLLARSCRGVHFGFGPVAGRVRRVADGDTFVLESGPRVRLLGIDAPEHGEHPLAERAKLALEELVLGRFVKLERGRPDRDRYERFLRYVFVERDGEQLFVNAELVRRGLAEVYRKAETDERLREIISAEEEARRAARGLWAR